MPRTLQSVFFRWISALTLGVMLAGGALPATPARASAPVEYFYDSLEPHGRWVDHWQHGRVWYPTGVDEDWRPYTRGRWVQTEEYGWYWDSSERFGWATYHYGRWDFDEDFGWIWVPGDQWGPAWVDWRTGDGYVGWAPLPPRVVWRERAFDYGGIDIVSVRYRPTWCFVPERRFILGDIHRHIEPAARNVTIINRTTNITNYTVVNNTFVNNSVNVTRIQTATNTKITPVRVLQTAAPLAQPQPGIISRVTGQPPAQVAVFRPEVRAGIKAPPATPTAVAVTPVPGGTAGKQVTSPVTPASPASPVAAGPLAPVPQLPKGGFVNRNAAPVPAPTPPLAAEPKRTPPYAPAPVAAKPAAPPSKAERELDARQARESARQSRSQVIERVTTSSQKRPEVVTRQAAERQELRRIQDTRKIVVQNRAAIPQPARAPAPAKAAPAKAPPPKPDQPAPPQPRQPR
jgi:hypothetical protein